TGRRRGRGETTEMANKIQKRPRVLCLHGIRTSAEIFKKMIGRWPQTLLEQLDLVFLDAPFPPQGKSDVEGIYDPPYYEWFHSKQDFREHSHFEECLEYLEACMLKDGPFDGLLGFSQGAIISAALPGMQREGVALTKVPKIKFVIIISGAKFGGSKLGLPKLAANAFSSPVQCPSLHIIGIIRLFVLQISPSSFPQFRVTSFLKNQKPGGQETAQHCSVDRVSRMAEPIGETDFLKEEGIALLEFFKNPLVIHHPYGHAVPRLDEKSLETFQNFIEKIQKLQLHMKVTCRL
ncbi:hypothetical protein RJ640_010421, partial [Escallonia rubra]